MKVIYEIGDIVMLDDDIYVPYELANEEVELTFKFEDSFWEVEHNGKKYTIHEKWFCRYVSSIFL